MTSSQYDVTDDERSSTAVQTDAFLLCYIRSSLPHKHHDVWLRSVALMLERVDEGPNVRSAGRPVLASHKARTIPVGVGFYEWIATRTGLSLVLLLSQ